ncbi:unnamed protein product [Pedinophyceae sp. YPF-701]|nr:unnamed protein product [Pedinophyceae sp. YPF-701]
MDQALYDEFGNYIGPELSGSESEEEDEQEASPARSPAAAAMSEDGDGGDDGEGDDGPGTAVVLHEDKKFYPTAEEVYGPGTEALVMEEDAQPIEVPIIAPPSSKVHDLFEEEPPATTYSAEFLAGLMGNADLVRHVAVCGHLHHGKTTLMDLLVEQTHAVAHEMRANQKQLRYTDTRADEQARVMSLKTVPMSLVLEGGNGKHRLYNLLDAPGHPNFADEATAAARLADGMLLVVDAVEGVMMGTRTAVKLAVQEDLPVCLVVTKVDRLATELKLPPNDAYHKLRHTIEEVNRLIEGLAPGSRRVRPVDPAKGSVCFAGALYGFAFTLQSFAKLYDDVQCGGGRDVDVRAFAKRLWGDYFFDPSTRKFLKKAPPGGRDRSFVEFVLEPLYKLISQVVGEDAKTLQSVLYDEFGASLKPSEYHQSSRPLLKLVAASAFGAPTGLADMMTEHLPTAREAAPTKLEMCYTGPLDSALADHVRACNPRGPLVVHVAKLVPNPDQKAFGALGRVMSGTVQPGDRVRVLGESYSPEDEEDASVQEVAAVQVLQARYRLGMTKAGAGNLVLLAGVDETISKTATIVSDLLDDEDEPHIFRPLRFPTRATVKIATEPLNPSELPKMVDALRKAGKSYPLLSTRVEESGEHTLVGTGELYLDSVMRDIRETFAEVEVKVADPVVTLCETVVETSSLKCFAETPNRKNKITMIAEPLDRGLGEDIEAGAVDASWGKKKLGAFLQGKYDWDLLAARSVWAFGPDDRGPNVLLDDTLPGEVDKQLMAAARASVVQGFRWGAREGPLCDEPMRNVKFKLMGAQVAPDPISRGGGQVIPTARRVCYSAFLMATPRLMEPVYEVEVISPADCLQTVYSVLAKRRGHVTSEAPKPGTPVFIFSALLPVLESFGFETDLRYHTQGQAFCTQQFDHWTVVPGDPLDRTVVLRPLEPAPVNALARELMVKTRRRKGMSEDVSVAKFFDDPMLLELARQDADLHMLL